MSAQLTRLGMRCCVAESTLPLLDAELVRSSDRSCGDGLWDPGPLPGRRSAGVSGVAASCEGTGRPGANPGRDPDPPALGVRGTGCGSVEPRSADEDSSPAVDGDDPGDGEGQMGGVGQQAPVLLERAMPGVRPVRRKNGLAAPDCVSKGGVCAGAIFGVVARVVGAAATGVSGVTGEAAAAGWRGGRGVRGAGVASGGEVLVGGLTRVSALAAPLRLPRVGAAELASVLAPVRASGVISPEAAASMGTGRLS